MAHHLSDLVDLDYLLRAIRDGLLLLQPAHAGAIKVVIQSETGEPLHVVNIDARRPLSAKPVLPSGPHHTPLADLISATSSAVRDPGLLQRCHEQQQRIAELEQRLREVQHQLDEHARSSSPADRMPRLPAPSTDDDDNSSTSSGNGDSPHRSSGGETDDDDDDDHVPRTSTNATVTAEGGDAAASSSSSSSTTVRKSERSKTNVDRWCPPAQHDAPPCRPTEQSLSQRKRRTKRRRRSPHADDDDDEERSISADVEAMEVDSAGDHGGHDDNDAAEVSALVVKLREGHDKRQSVVLDSLSKESILSLRRQVLDEAGDHASSISMQITSLISTSTSAKMLGYYLRAILAHRLKLSSHNCYKRLARETLGLKSPADIAAHPALYEFVQHHYPTLASAAIDVWLENPIFTADITWTEWKRYLTKPGRPIIDAALQQFNAATAPFQDWLQLGWVEIYDDEKLGQGVRALRDIRMPTSKAKEAQRDVAASISVVVADLQCAGAECVLDKDAAREADATYLVQLDRQRVFDARHHWVGKINHFPDRLCNLKLTSAGELVQTRKIAAGEALTFDYGVDYWVYQLSGLELSGWLSSSSVQSNRGTLDLFRRMHRSLLDYAGLLCCDWVQRPPAVWTELNRECWIANLAGYLEDRGL